MDAAPVAGQADRGAPNVGRGLEQFAQDSFFLFLDVWQDVEEVPMQPGSSQGGGGSQGQAPSQQQQLFYHNQIKNLRLDDKRTLFVDWQHLVAWNSTAADTIMGSYYRLEPSLRKAVQALARKVEPEFCQVGVGQGEQEDSLKLRKLSLHAQMRIQKRMDLPFPHTCAGGGWQ